MIVLPEINPEAFRIGPVAVRWYGLMYVFGFAAAFVLGSLRLKRHGNLITPDQFQSLLLYLILGVIIGGRLGYILFYTNFGFLQRPWEIIEVWKGGMSFHGGLAGVAVAILLFSHLHGVRLLDLCDFIAPLSPLGLMAGRIGNFINGELWGRPSNLPWATVFPYPASGGIPRHPSQLYEALLEGFVLFVILLLFSRKIRPGGAVSGLFLLLYGTFRFFVEFTRQPDLQMGFVLLNWMTMGQILSVPMVAIGAWLLFRTEGSIKI